jgi:CrcB protein
MGRHLMGRHLMGRHLPGRLRSSTPAALAVLAGGMIGSSARAGAGLLLPAGSGDFPVATFLVNIAGSLLLGLYLARRQRAVTTRWSLQLWAIGALGSFTTFSAFSFEVVRLIDAERAGVAAAYAVASLCGGLAAALLGERLGGA